MGDTGKIEFSSKFLNYYADKNIVILDSNVVVHVNKITIKGDSLVFYSDNNVAKGYENVSIQSKHQNIVCDSIYYNIKTKKGVIFQGTSEMPQGIFKGQIITQDSNKVLKIYNAKFTTCDKNPPHYYFYSSKIKMYEDNYALVKPLVMYVHDIPVFFAPFWFFPVREERHSGFLVPNIGASNDEGKFVKNISFFWAMNPFMDATFTVNIMELKGIEGVINYEYLLKPIIDGKIDFSYVNEFSGNTRWKGDIEHKETLFKDGNLIIKGNFSSDNMVEEDYNDSVLVLLDKEIYSYLSFTKRLWKINTNLVLENRKNLSTNDFHNKLPSFSVSLPSFNLFPKFQSNWFGGSYFSFGNSFNNSYDTLSHTIANGSNISIASNFKLLKYFKIGHTISSNVNYSYDSVSTENVNLSNRVNLYTNIYGFTKYPFFNVKKVRHTITPSVSFAFNNIYLSGDTAYWGPIGLSVKNVFEAKLKKGGIVKLLNLNFSSSYSPYTKLFSDVNISGDMALKNWLSVRAATSLDPYTLLFQSYNLNVTSNFTMPFFDDSLVINADYNIGNNFSIPGQFNNYMNLTVSGNLTPGWSLNYTGRVDFDSMSIVNQQISLVRDLHCWELSIGYQTFATNYKLDVNLHIKKLPTVKIGKGIFDIFGL